MYEEVQLQVSPLSVKREDVIFDADLIAPPPCGSRLDQATL